MNDRGRLGRRLTVVAIELSVLVHLQVGKREGREREEEEERGREGKRGGGRRGSEIKRRQK